MIGRIAALLMHLRRSTIGQLVLVIGVGLLLGLVLLLQVWLGEGATSGLRGVLALAPIFGLGGIFLMVSALLDVRSGFLKSDWPRTRILLGAASLAGLVANLQWAIWGALLWPWIICACAIGAVMAWLGWRWMKYVDFYI